MTLAQAFQIALQHHRSGRLVEAEALYRQILAAQPNHADALHLLGVIAHQAGRHELAVELIRQAIVLNPNHPAAHSNLGEACRAIHRLDEAISAFHRALELKWDSPEALNNLGLALHERGQLDKAISAYRRALEIKTAFPEAHNNLGAALAGQGRFAEALASFRHALALHPAYPEAQNNLGNALAEQGSLEQAVAAFHRALELKPDDPEALNNLGGALTERGQLDEAVAAFRRALELRRDYPEALNHLGKALAKRGQIDEALASFRHALALQPEYAGAHSNLLYLLHFRPGDNAPAISAEQERWRRQFAEPLRHLRRPHANDRSPERRLRIGYVSPDFRNHVIRHFLTPLLEFHNHAHFEIYCYASVKRPDQATDRLKRAADVWRDVLALSDDTLAQRIRDDQIDLLVDLTLHMADHRLLVFARKPAPIQISWLGYPGSTGLSEMDYHLTDAWMEPEGAPWSDAVDPPFRLPASWFCFDPLDEYPQPGELPALRAGYVTFGSLNNFTKVNEDVLALWATILRNVEGSRLLLQCPAGTTQSRVRDWFEARGIAAHRLDLVSWTAQRATFLQLFAQIDIALDPFPYHGGTTTCEALWMGVPVVTLAGETAVSRAGLSILANLGLPELVAHSEIEYVKIAESLARDLPRLAQLRSTLRMRMKASVLMDAPRFARDIEAAYRTMWKRWRASQSSLPNVSAS